MTDPAQKLARWINRKSSRNDLHWIGNDPLQSAQANARAPAAMQHSASSKRCGQKSQPSDRAAMRKRLPEVAPLVWTSGRAI